MKKVIYSIITLAFVSIASSSNAQSSLECDKEKYQSVCGGVADECRRETFENGVCIWYKGEW